MRLARHAALILFFACCCLAQDHLGQMREILKGMRGPDTPYDELRGANPKFTQIKHLLRDWVETRLSDLASNKDGAVLKLQLNQELRAAGLICSPDFEPCNYDRDLGFLLDIDLFSRRNFLVLITRIGMQTCGTDDSAYLYEHKEQAWRRVWQNERNDYTKEAHLPQRLTGIQVSSYSKSEGKLILSMGVMGWCSSVWHPLYHRVFRLGAEMDAPPLTEWSEMGVVDSMKGSVDGDKVLVEYQVIGADAYRRTVTRAYQPQHGGLDRMDPLALSPRDFAEEWLSLPWGEAGLWSEPTGRASMVEFRRKIPRDAFPGLPIFPTMHCPSNPDLWQVGMEGLLGPKGPATYFLVRWRPPYRFSMVDVKSTPWAMCSKPDPDADERRTLFPGRSGGLP
jgi:hypothetical protein